MFCLKISDASIVFVANVSVVFSSLPNQSSSFVTNNADNKYIKPVKQKTPAQREAEAERNKAMWQENQELKEEIARLKAMYEKK